MSVGAFIFVAFFLSCIFYPLIKYLERQQTIDETKEPETVFLDLETTGLEPEKNEVVEIAIIDNAGNTVLKTLLRPTRRKRWPKAEKIHGISPKMVKEAPTIEEIAEKIREAVKNKRVVIYNVRFDIAFLGGTLNEALDICCCMLRFSDFKKVPNPYRKNDYKWFKLQDAAKQAGYKSPGEAHRALSDALATREVWRYLNQKGQTIEPMYRNAKFSQ